MNKIQTAIGSVVVISMVVMMGWLYAQNKIMSEQLTVTQQFLKQSSSTSANDISTQRLNRLEQAVEQLTWSVGSLHASLSTQDEYEGFARMNDLVTNQQAMNIDLAALSPSEQPREDVKFTDAYVESRQKSSVNQGPDPQFTNKVYDKLYAKIVEEGEAPEQAALITNGLEQLRTNNARLAGDLQYEQPVCSDYRCVVRAHVSKTSFSTQQFDTGAEFAAEDAYHNFTVGLQRAIDQSLSRKTQIAISRRGDELVFNIFPKASLANAAGE